MAIHGLFSVKHFLYLHSPKSEGGDRSCISAVSESLQRYKYFLLQSIFPDVVEQKRDIKRMRRAVGAVRDREMGNLKQHVCSAFHRYIFHRPTLSELGLAESQFFQL
jgi:hypothetical protein